MNTVADKLIKLMDLRAQLMMADRQIISPKWYQLERWEQESRELAGTIEDMLHKRG